MTLPINKIIQGNCIDVLQQLPPESVDLIFADPPYNLQLSKELWRPDSTKVDAVTDDWDQFESFQSYDEFTRAWLKGCRHVLKDTGTLWVIGSYHNIYRIGSIIQDLDFWILNDVIWIKTNPMPNFKGVRFTNAHETLIWVSKAKGNKYTFNHHAMKELNDGKQMRSDWIIPLCTGEERIKVNGEKAHPTQKPEGLLYRVILSSSNPKDTVLDPFFGAGTSGAVAKKLHRNWIGIEQDENYIEIAQNRINQIIPEPFEAITFDIKDKKRLAPRISFASLLEVGLILPGQELYFKNKRNITAKIKPDGKLVHNNVEGSIHQTARNIMDGRPCNGWELWFYKSDDGNYYKIDKLREIVRRQ